MNEADIIAEIDAEIARLHADRAKIAAAQKKRWAKGERGK